MSTTMILGENFVTENKTEFINVEILKLIENIKSKINIYVIIPQDIKKRVKKIIDSTDETTQRMRYDTYKFIDELKEIGSFLKKAKEVVDPGKSKGRSKKAA